MERGAFHVSCDFERALTISIASSVNACVRLSRALSQTATSKFRFLKASYTEITAAVLNQALLTTSPFDAIKISPYDKRACSGLRQEPFQRSAEHKHTPAKASTVQ